MDEILTIGVITYPLRGSCNSARIPAYCVRRLARRVWRVVWEFVSNKFFDQIPEIFVTSWRHKCAHSSRLFPIIHNFYLFYIYSLFIVVSFLFLFVFFSFNNLLLDKTIHSHSWTWKQLLSSSAAFKFIHVYELFIKYWHKLKLPSSRCPNTLYIHLCQIKVYV